MADSEPLIDAELRRWCERVIFALAVVHAFAMRHFSSADGVSYIDIASNWLHHGWQASVNAYFSPLYSWAIMPALAANPPPRWETPLIHVVNLAILILSMAAFRWFLYEFALYFKPSHITAWTLASYGLFAWAFLHMIAVGLIAPDMLYAAVIFALAALLCRIQSGRGTFATALALGAFWAIGFLVRSAILPLIAVTAVIAFLGFGAGIRAIVRVIVAGICAAIIAAPWVMALHSATGRWTLSDAGTLNYSWLVNRIPWEHARYPGMPHPTRMVAEHPAVYEFASPVIGTYPPWTDPAYWDEGLPLQIDFKAHAIYIAKNVRRMFVLALQLGGFLAALAALWVWGADRQTARASLVRSWWLILLSVAALSVYAAVNVEPRYFASFWIILWLTLWTAVRLPETPEARRLASAAAAGFALTVALGLAEFTVTQFSFGADATANLMTAQALHEAGVAENTPVATLAIDNDVHWARLGRLKIVAEIPSTEASEFWSSDTDRRRRTIAGLTSAGARYLISGQAPPSAEAPDWHPVGRRRFYLLPLP